MSYTIGTQTVYSMTDIRNNSGHWFDAATMRFFNSRVGDTVYNGPGGCYFVSSERYDYNSPRNYTVRQFIPGTRKIETIGPFNRYSRATAHRLAKQYAAGAAHPASE